MMRKEIDLSKYNDDNWPFLVIPDSPDYIPEKAVLPPENVPIPGEDEEYTEEDLALKWLKSEEPDEEPQSLMEVFDDD